MIVEESSDWLFIAAIALSASHNFFLLEQCLNLKVNILTLNYHPGFLVATGSLRTECFPFFRLFCCLSSASSLSLISIPFDYFETVQFYVDRSRSLATVRKKILQTTNELFYFDIRWLRHYAFKSWLTSSSQFNAGQG